MRSSGVVRGGVLLAVALGGCAQMLPGGTPKPVKVAPDTAGAYDGGFYALSEEEKKLDCKKLTGRMQVRILQLRDPANRPVGSAISQGAQVAIKPILGGTAFGVDPAQSMARDRAMLEAYNAQLKAKNCATYDLEKELATPGVRETPRPQPKS